MDERAVGYDELLEDILEAERYRKVVFEEAMQLSDGRRVVGGIQYEFFNELENARKFKNIMKISNEYSDTVCKKAYELYSDYDVPEQVFIKHNDYYFKLEHLNIPEEMAFYAFKV